MTFRPCDARIERHEIGAERLLRWEGQEDGAARVAPSIDGGCRREPNSRV